MACRAGGCTEPLIRSHCGAPLATAGLFPSNPANGGDRLLSVPGVAVRAERTTRILIGASCLSRLSGRTWAARSMKLCAINDRAGRWVLLNQSGKLSSKGEQLLGGRGKTRGAIDLHVASRVREQRILLGISQTQMATALGLTFQQVYKYEQGKNRISAGRLYEFGKILGVPITFFFEGVVDAPTSAAALPSAGDADPLETREAGELLRAYRAISDPLLRLSVRRLARALAPESNGSTAKASASQRRRPSRRMRT